MNVLRGLLIAGCVFGVGCRSKPPEPTPEAPKPKLEYRWFPKGNRVQLRVPDSSNWVLDVDLGSGSTHVTVEASQPFSIGPTVFKDVRSAMPVKVSVLPWLGDLDLASRQEEPIDWQVPVEAWLSRDGSQRWKGTLPPFVVRPTVARVVLEGKAPLVFLGDDVAPERPDTIYVNFKFGNPPEPLIGTGTRLRDVDWIAVNAWRPTGKKKKCGGYGRGTVGDTVVTVSLEETEVRVIDRRTGAVLGSKVFPPESRCPGAAMGTEAAVGANTDVILAWLEKQLAAGKVSEK